MTCCKNDLFDKQKLCGRNLTNSVKLSLVSLLNPDMRTVPLKLNMFKGVISVVWGGCYEDHNLDSTIMTEVTMEGASKVKKQLPYQARTVRQHFLSVFTAEPGGHTPFHTHAFEHLNYIIDGEGAVVTQMGEEKPVKKGDFVLVLPGEKHQYKNKSSSRPFVMICAVPKEYE